MPLNKVIDGSRPFNEVIREICSMIGTAENNNYYFLPFWFQQLSNQKLQLHSFESLPADLKEGIKFAGDEIVFQKNRNNENRAYYTAIPEGEN